MSSSGSSRCTRPRVSRPKDALLADVSGIETITALDLGGSKELTDDGVRHLVRLPALRHLDLSATAITDRGLQVLRDLPALETISLAGTRVTDEGVAQLAHCHELRQVNLSWTRTGDGALRALAGKRNLHEFASGNDVTDAGIPLLHELPVFKSWQGGEIKVALLSYPCEASMGSSARRASQGWAAKPAARVLPR